jgi:hypothetical protein
LTTDRQLGFGAEGRIPASSIRTFAHDHGIASADDYAWFLAVIREMDAEYLGMRAPRPGGQILEEVPVTDARGISALVKRLAKKPVTTAV